LPKQNPCGRTRQELDDHPKNGKNARLEKGVKDKGADPYPRDIDQWLVHKDARLDDWVCSACGHLISEHRSEGAATKYIDAGPWPSAFCPDLLLKAATTQLKFVKTNDGDGPWCFESDTVERMIRVAEYTRLWQRVKDILKTCGMKERRKGLLVTGHPGIGKTLLLDLILSWILHDFPTTPVMVIGANGVTIFVNTTTHIKKRYRLKLVDIGHVLPMLLQCGVSEGSTVVVLHDIKTKESLHFQEGFLEDLVEKFSVVCVVSSSPKPSNYKDFEKWMKPSATHVLPTLSEAEAWEYAARVRPGLKPDDFVKNFHAVGGVPRHLRHAVDVAAAIDKQSIVVTTVKFDPGKLVNIWSDDDPSAIVRAVPKADRGGVAYFDFVSSSAVWLWVARGDAATVSKQLQRLRDAKDEDTRDMLGHVFEAWFLTTLRKSPSTHLPTEPLRLCWRRLNPPTPTGASLEVWSLPSPMDVNQFAGNDASSIGPNATPTLWIPQSTNFPVVDAILVDNNEVTLIQVTVSPAHKPGVRAIDSLMSSVKLPLVIKRIVWVVDAESKLAATQPLDNTKPGTLSTTDVAAVTKKYDAIPQYLVRVDEWMCWVQEGSKGSTKFCFPVLTPAPLQDSIEAMIKKQLDASKTVKLQKFVTGSGIGTFAAPLTYKVC
jgi:hypothetical protein